MTQDQTESPGYSLFLENGEIFFRESDISRMQRLFGTVVDDGLHFVMTSQFDGPIDHYGKIFLNRLKMRSGLAVETFMPASTDSFIARFNALLNDVSVDQARGEKEHQSAGRIIVVNDLSSADNESLSLLMRLISDFPGLNIRLVFLVGYIPKNMERVLERLGSKLVRWEVVPPSPDEQMIMRRDSMRLGLEFQVERVLSRINQALADRLEPSFDFDQNQASLQLDAIRALGSGSEAGEREAEDIKALFDEQPEPRSSGGKGRLFLIFVLLIGVAGAGASIINFEVGRYVSHALSLLGVDTEVFHSDDSGRSVVDAAYDKDVDFLPKSILPDSEVSPKLIEPIKQRVIEVKEIADPGQLVENRDFEGEAAQMSDQFASVESSVEPTEVTGSQDGGVNELSSESDLNTSLELSDEAVLTSEAELLENSDTSELVLAEVRNADPTSQFIQHIVLASQQRVTEWRQQQTGLDRAIVIPVSINNAKRYAVVSGPFQTRADVRAYIQGMDQNADYWVRTARSLQQIVSIED